MPKTHIRNLAFLGSSLAEKTSFIKAISSLAKNSPAIQTNSMPDDLYLQVTASTSIYTLTYSISETENYQITILDTTGLIDLIGESFACLNLVDGAIIVIDLIEGLDLYTEEILKKCLNHQVKVTIVVQNFDKLLYEKNLSPSEICQICLDLIEAVNMILVTYQDDFVEPFKGNFLFCSSNMQWALDMKKLCETCWDEVYENDIELVKSGNREAKIKVFEMIICEMQIIKEFCFGFYEEEEEEIQIPEFMMMLGIDISYIKQFKDGDELFPSLLQTFFPFPKTLLDMIINCIPGPLESKNAMINSISFPENNENILPDEFFYDPLADMLVVICNFIELAPGQPLVGLGRLISSNIVTDKSLYLHTQNLKPISVSGSEIRFGLLLGPQFIPSPNIFQGSIIAIENLPASTQPFSILTNLSSQPKLSFKTKKCTSSFKCLLELHNLSLHNSYQTVLNDVKKRYSYISVNNNIEGGFEIKAYSVLIIDLCKRFISKRIIEFETMQNIETVYLESINETSKQICLSKSPNKHNRAYGIAMPMNKMLAENIENFDINLEMDRKVMSKKLEDNFGWSRGEALKIWSLGTIESEPNVLVDDTKGAQYMNEIKDYAICAFHWVISEGILINEPVRNARFNIIDYIAIADSIHRGGGQVIPMFKRMFIGSLLTASPILLEPIMLFEIKNLSYKLNELLSNLKDRHAKITHTKNHSQSPFVIVKGVIPADYTYDLQETIQTINLGLGYSNMIFSHWKAIKGLYNDPSTPLGEKVIEIRHKKSLSPVLPNINNYLDKL